LYRKKISNSDPTQSNTYTLWTVSWNYNYPNVVIMVMKIQKSPWFKHGEFWISLFQYMEIQKSPCIETWRFCKAELFIFSNLRVSIQRDSKISVYKAHKFLNLKNIRVLKHGDSKTSVFYTSRFFFIRPITRWNRNRWWKYFRVWIRGLGTTNLWKNQSLKISCYCPFNNVTFF